MSTGILKSYPVFQEWAPWVQANLSNKVLSALAVPGKPGFIALGYGRFWGMARYDKREVLYYGRTFNSLDEAIKAVSVFEQAIKDYHDDADQIMNGRR